jgi:hypothetical protein
MNPNTEFIISGDININTIKRTIFRKVRKVKKSEKGNYFETIKHFGFAFISVWIRKLDIDSLTKKKN